MKIVDYFLKNNNIEIAGIEYITDKSGIRYTYDVNTNTNYNVIAENKAKIDGMYEIAKFLKKELNLTFGKIFMSFLWLRVNVQS